MSLINQMLKDLDARRASDVRDSLHREVRPLPAVAAGNGVWRVGLVLLLAAGAIGAGLFWLRPVSSPPPPVDVKAPPPAPSAAASPTPLRAPEAAAEAPVALQLPSEAVPARAGGGAAIIDPATPGTPASGIPTPATLAREAGGVADRRSPPDRALPPAAAKPPLASAAHMSTELSVPAPVAASADARLSSVRPSVSPKAVPATVGAVEKTVPAGSPRAAADADFRRAVMLVNAGRSDEAVDLLLDTLRRDGAHVSARQLAARLLLEQGRTQPAAALLAEGLAAQPGQIQWAMLLARLQVDGGDLDGAAATLRNSQAFAAASAEYQGFAGFVAHRRGHAGDAVAYYRAATGLATGEGRWWLGLGIALEADGQSGAAHAAFERARASGSLNADLKAIVDQKLR